MSLSQYCTTASTWSAAENVRATPGEYFAKSASGVGAWFSLAQLHAQWRRPAEGDFGPQGDVALGLGPADLRLGDHQRLGCEQLLEVSHRLPDVGVLCCRCAGQCQQQHCGEQTHQPAHRLHLLSSCGIGQG
jgi:hypothetical protein